MMRLTAQLKGSEAHEQARGVGLEQPNVTDELRTERGKWIQVIQHAREADRRGWGSIGRMLADGRRWSGAKFGRELRRSNRLYRIANGRSPWRPFNGF